MHWFFMKGPAEEGKIRGEARMYPRTGRLALRRGGSVQPCEVKGDAESLLTSGLPMPRFDARL